MSPLPERPEKPLTQAEKLELVLKHFRTYDRFARHSGIEIVDAAPGKATVRMRVQDFHLNGADTTHGGALFTLGDFALAIASNSHGVLSLAVNATISYYKVTGVGAVITARAEELSLRKNLASYQVRMSDEQGDLVALFQGMVFRKQSQPPLF